ncbi:hypothetical protein QTI66_38645 [Variovorax sp. J22R133]|uniref:hypothetical protein n=1 Tax=Variovorax brevis TaxID=3053503 RepID=UPI0025761B9D|nr:hypothetical protein [Variovorax sp. J22R133]MDM0118006.1 hypothetical protein [Variovorax sp. J22R133]
MASAAEFRCADLKPSDARQPPYQRVAGQVRCEGFYDRNVSQPFIELVSLTASMPPTAGGTALQFSGSRRVPTRLVVHPLRPAPFYRVDAPIEAAQSLRWDPSPMLDATGLQLRDLGFLALAPERDGILTVVPVAFALPTAEPQLPAKAVLRVSVPVATLAWRRLRLDGSEDGGSAWREIPGAARFAWERVPFALELPADGHGVRVDVQAVDPGGKVLPLLRFNVSGPADAGP